MKTRIPSLLIASSLFLAGCSAIEWSTATSAVTASAPVILDALMANGVKIGSKTTADVQAAGYALDLLAKAQNGYKITAEDISTGIPKIDNVMANYVKAGTLTSDGYAVLSSVARQLIGK